MPTTPPEGRETVTTWASPDAARAWQRSAGARAEVMARPTQLMLELAGLQPGSRVLDIAAGTGDQTLLAAQRVGAAGSVLATDLSASMLEVAAQAARQAGLANVRTHAVDAEHLELEPDSFDAAISRNGLMLIPDLPRALAAIRRALKPGGKLAAAVWSGREKNPWIAVPEQVVRDVGRPPPAGRPGPFALGDPGAFEAALTAAGFREVVVHALPVNRRFASAVEAVSVLKESVTPVTEAIARLSEPDRERVWAELEARFRRFEGADGCLFPGEALVGVGTK